MTLKKGFPWIYIDDYCKLIFQNLAISHGYPFTTDREFFLVQCFGVSQPQNLVCNVGVGAVILVGVHGKRADGFSSIQPSNFINIMLLSSMECKKTPHEYDSIIKNNYQEILRFLYKPIVSVKTAGKSRYKQAHYNSVLKAAGTPSLV